MDRANTFLSGPSEHIPQWTERTHPSMEPVNTALNGQSTNTVADEPNEHSPHWTDRTQPSMDRTNTALSGPTEHNPQ